MDKLENLAGKSLLLVDNYGLALPPIIDLIVAHSPIKEDDIFTSPDVPNDWQEYLQWQVSLAIIHPPFYNPPTAHRIITGFNLGIATVVLLRTQMTKEDYESVKLLLNAKIPTLVRGLGFTFYKEALEMLNDHLR